MVFLFLRRVCTLTIGFTHDANKSLYHEFGPLNQIWNYIFRLMCVACSGAVLTTMIKTSDTAVF